MKLFRTLAMAAVAACLMVTTSFAAPDISGPQGNDQFQQKNKAAKMERCKEFSKDPVKAIQDRKEKVRSLLKEGKITKEKADAINAKLDAKLKEIKEFDKLTLQQKRDKLVKDFKASMDRKVKEGRLAQDKADTMMKDFTEKMKTWDGKGYPQFRCHGFKGKGLHPENGKK